MISNIEPYRIRENFNPYKPYFHKRDAFGAVYKNGLQDFFNDNTTILQTFPGKENNGDHFCLKVNPIVLNEGSVDFQFETSYFVGAQWLVKDKLPLIVHPKFIKSKEDSTSVEIDYIKLMVEALQPSENAEHLEDLLFINFKETRLKIRQKDDLLSPLLIIQYLHLLNKIVKRGLKNSYYRKQNNLKSRVRGKILVSATVKHNHAQHKMLNTYCAFDEFGVDHEENRLLKKALLFALAYLEPLKKTRSDFNEIDQMVRFIKSAFQNVSDEINVDTVKHFRPNPMFKEYSEALKLAQLILKRFGYNISSTSDEKIETPPFWIDMSKLFELYVLSLLRKRFPQKEEILYQPNINDLFPDYLLNSTNDNYQMVVDAKYKNYSESSINVSDIRQISGYSRLDGVYKKFDRKSNDISNIDCLFIFPNLDSDNDFSNMKRNLLPNYRNIYKLGVSLPKIK